MNNLMTVHTLGPQLIALLGLPKHCVSFELRCAVGEIVTVNCEYHPEDADGVDLVLAEYELVPRQTRAAVEPHPAEAIGFDAWMRNRIEGAHQVMMSVVRLGGVEYGQVAAPLQSWAPGDKVMLRSGGPEMTANNWTSDGREVACSWAIDNLMNYGRFPVECLTMYDKAIHGAL